MIKNIAVFGFLSVSAIAAVEKTPVVTAVEQSKPIRQAQDRPNIVFLMTDDQRWDMLGCYGRKDVITPNIDRLAEKGVTFDNAFYAVAICMPSRTTMFTGRYFSDHRGGFSYPYNRTIPVDEFAESYPAKLKEAGYRTGFVGKFNVRVEGNRDTFPSFFDFFVEGNAVVVPKDDPELKKIYSRDRPANERALKKGDAMLRFLDTQPKGQPFCLSISFDAVKNDKDEDMYPPDVEVFKDMVMEIPENWVQGRNTKLPDVLDRCRGTYLHAKRTATPEQYQTTTRRFAVQGYTVDKQVGRLVEKLEEMGVLDNTIIIYTSDNGRFHGSHGLFDKALLYDESVKEPLIVFDGRSPESRRGIRVNAMVSSTDIAPTIVSLGGVEPPAAMKGKDLSGLLNGNQDMTKWRDTVLMENFFLQDMYTEQRKKGTDLEKVNQEIIAKNESYRTRGVRTERFKYFSYYEAIPVVEELYDFENDPHEMNNLISNPEYASVLADLRKRTEDLTAAATE